MSHNLFPGVLFGLLAALTAASPAGAQQNDSGSEQATEAAQVPDLPAKPTGEGEAGAGSEKPQVLEVGNPAPPLSIAHWFGEPVDSLEAGQVYVVEFWATWCGPCRAGMPHISELQEHYGNDVVFIGVTREPEGTVANFLSANQSEEKTWKDVIKYRLAIDSDSTTNTAYMRAAGQSGIPCAFLVGRDGVVEWLGHPASIDAPLAKVVAGSWDRQAAVAQFRMKKRLNEASREIAALCRDNKWDDALAIVDGLEGELGSSADSTRAKLNLLRRAERPEEVAELQKKLVDQVWDDANALNEIAWNTATSKEKQDLDLALKAAERASGLRDHKDAAILDTLARVFYEQGNLDKALEWQRKAAEHNSEHRSIVDALVKYETEKVLQLDPSDPRREIELARIEKLKSPISVIHEAGGRCGFKRGSSEVVVSVTFENTLDLDAKLPRLRQHLEKLPSLESITFTRMQRISFADRDKKPDPLPPNAGVTDAGLEQITGLVGLKTISLQGVAVGDAGLEHVGKLTGLNTISILGTEITDAGLKNLKGLKDLRSLQLWNAEIDGSGLEHLTELPALAVLNLSNTPLEDAALKHVMEMSALASLNLSNTKIGDAGLEHLEKLRSLKILDLSGTSITDAGLEHLSTMTNLSSLNLSGTPIHGEGLAHLSKLNQLSSLNLRKTAVSDDNLEFLADLAGLRMLSLDETGITDEGLRHLRGLTELYWLTLSGTKITDDGLPHLAGLVNLQMLGRSNTQVTPAGYGKLRGSLPKLRR